MKVYNLFWRLSKKSKARAISITNSRIAMLIGARCEGKRADYITRAKMALVRAHWLRFEGVSKISGTGTWMGGRYIVISHEEWAKQQSFLLGHSPCQPKPLAVGVASVHPGGRSFRKSKLGSAEARTASSALIWPPDTHRAGEEARTDLLSGSTHRARAGKHAQSVDLEPSVDIHTVDATAIMPPVAMRVTAIADEPKVNPPGQEKPKPSEEEPENDRMQDSYESWLAEARDKVSLAAFNLHYAAYRSFMGKAGRAAKDFAPPHLASQPESHTDTAAAASGT